MTRRVHSLPFDKRPKHYLLRSAPPARLHWWLAARPRRGPHCGSTNRHNQPTRVLHRIAGLLSSWHRPRAVPSPPPIVRPPSRLRTDSNHSTGFSFTRSSPLPLRPTVLSGQSL